MEFSLMIAAGIAGAVFLTIALFFFTRNTPRETLIQRAWLFGLILGIPIVGVGVSEAIQAYSNSQLRIVLSEQYPDEDPDVIAAMTMDHLCSDSDPELARVCSDHANLNFMSAASAGTGLAGLVLLLAIRLAGKIAGSSRAMLLFMFRPGLYLTGLALIILVAAHASIAMAVIYFGESALIERVHVGILIVIGVGAIVGVYAIARNVFALVKKAETVVTGTNVTRAQAPALWTKIERIAWAIGALPPQHVVVGLDPNFFVTEADVVCLSGRLSGRTLYCSLPLSRILTKSEFSAIAGHELGHFKGADTQFNSSFYPVYRGTGDAMTARQTAGGEGAGLVELLPAIAVFGYFLDSFSIAENRIGRERELIADREGATVTDAETMATALVKVHAFAGFWDDIEERAAQMLRDGKMLTNASLEYAEAVSRAGEDALKGLTEVNLTDPTDSHPPLGLRLKSLGTDLERVSRAALQTTPDDAAIHLIKEPEKIEEEINHAYHGQLARELGLTAINN